MTEQRAKKIAESCVRTACEIPYRFPPEGWEDYILLTPEEMENVIRQELEREQGE